MRNGDFKDVKLEATFDESFKTVNGKETCATAAGFRTPTKF